MKSWIKFVLIFGLITVVVAGGAILGLLIITSDDDRNRKTDDDGDDEVVYPDTLPLGESPQLSFPFNSCSFDNINHIGDFSPSHNGIDFRVNDSSIVLCPHDAYVSDIRFYENEYGNHWQTNVRIRLNSQWYITMKFESWAEDQYNGTLQRNNVSVSVGDKILANQTMGILLSHDEYSHLHFDLDHSGTYVCPYSYFSPDGKDKFDPIYDRCGESSTPCH